MRIDALQILVKLRKLFIEPRKVIYARYAPSNAFRNHHTPSFGTICTNAGASTPNANKVHCDQSNTNQLHKY